MLHNGLAVKAFAGTGCAPIVESFRVPVFHTSSKGFSGEDIDFLVIELELDAPCSLSEGERSESNGIFQ